MNNDEANSSAVPLAGPAATGERGARIHPLDWPAEAQTADRIWQATQVKVRRRRQQRRTRLIAGAAAVCVLALAAWRLDVPGRAVDHAAATPAASVASSALMLLPERRLLADGSIVELRAGAEIRVAFEERRRRILLLAGEAHFAVAHDRSRPFVVDAGVEVRAVGTAFSVDLGQQQVDVLVTAGRIAVARSVEIAAPGTKIFEAAPLAFADVGHRVVIGRAAAAAAENPQVTPVARAELEQRIAWRAPRVELARTALTEVVAAINRHSRTQVELADPSIGAIRLSGVLRADNAETLLRLLRDEHGLLTDPVGADRVVVRRAR